MTLLALAKLLSYAGFSLLGGVALHRLQIASVSLGWLLLGGALVVLGAGLEIGSTLSALGFTAPADVADFLSTTPQGRAALWRLLGAALLLAAEVQRWSALSVLGATLLLWGAASAGHASEQGLVWVLFNAVHVLAASVWVGGVLGLAGRTVSAAQARRFGPLALACLATLLLSGVAAVLLRLPPGAALPALWGSTWGLALLLKVVLLALALLCALVVRRRLYAGRPAPLPLEAALLVLVLGASGVLSTTAPPSVRDVQPQRIAVRAVLAGQALSGQLQLSGPGQVTLRLTPALPGLKARLRMLDHPMPTQPLPLTKQGGAWTGETRLWMAGHWALELLSAEDVQRTEFNY